MKPFLFVSLCLCSCTPPDCIGVSKFEEKFEQSIVIVVASENGEDMYIDQKTDAIYFLEAVTGKKSHVDDPHIMLYIDKTQLAQDLDEWQKWHKKNKCALNEKTVDSLFCVYKNYQW